MQTKRIRHLLKQSIAVSMVIYGLSACVSKATLKREDIVLTKITQPSTDEKTQSQQLLFIQKPYSIPASSETEKTTYFSSNENNPVFRYFLRSEIAKDQTNAKP